MNFSGIPDTSLRGKLLRLPLRLIPDGTVVPILQGRLKGKKWIAGSSNHGCWLGSYEYEKRVLFEKMIEPGTVVYDIGAHVGFYTLLASLLVGPHGRVFAFEPFPPNLVHLRQHLQMNNVKNATVIEAAVARFTGEAFFEPGLGSSTGHIAPQGSLRVDAVALDDLVATGTITAPHCMKLDVEGAEVEVLLGARGILARAHPIVFVATHGPAPHEECCRLLGSLGYSVVPIGKKPIECSDELLAYPCCCERARILCSAA